MDALEFWRTAGPMTEVGDHRGWVAQLPTDPARLRDIVAAAIVHPGWAARYEVEIGDAGEAEKQLRRVDRMLTAARGRVDQPGSVKGIPARARCGHAGYFEAGKWVDHWVTEWWDPARDRWVRTGEIDPDTCGIFDMWGAWFVRSNAVRDLAALNKVELLPWDDWGIMGENIERSDDELDAAIDDLSAATVPADDLAALQRLFADVRYGVPTTITSYVDGTPVAVTIER